MTGAIAALEDPSPEMVEDLAALLLNSAHAASGPLVRAHDICQHLGDYLAGAQDEPSERATATPVGAQGMRKTFETALSDLIAEYADEDRDDIVDALERQMMAVSEADGDDA